LKTSAGRGVGFGAGIRQYRLTVCSKEYTGPSVTACAIIMATAERAVVALGNGGVLISFGAYIESRSASQSYPSYHPTR
jgi:hypothetical protein